MTQWTRLGYPSSFVYSWQSGYDEYFKGLLAVSLLPVGAMAGYLLLLMPI